MPVILFHAGLYRFFSGGFVGVDIFFVISGFLITGVILNDIHSSRFSIAQFYERRVRRIFPALFLTLFVTAAVAVVLLPPDVLVRFGRALVASTLFSSNVLFWREDGYFNETMWRNPILHTWSLSVEEQFYILYPLLLSLMRGASRQRLRVAIMGLLVVSLAFAAWGVVQAPTMAFYLMPSRAWELMLGALAAVEGLPRLRPRLLREVAAVAGLALIGWSVVTYSESTLFPGLAALVPCAGAALLIQSGMDASSIVNRLLAWRPVVFVGLISYPLYLWHWPILVFTREMLGEQLRHRDVALCIIASFILATATWKVLEQPIRRRTTLTSRRTLFAAAAACLVVTLGAGVGLAASGGFIWRYPPAARRLLASTADGGGVYFRADKCFITPEEPHFDAAVCLRLDPEKPNVLLLGDSHAAHLWYGLHQTYPGVNILQATAAGCRPVIGGSVQGKDICHPLVYSVLRDFLPAHRVDAVILSGGWWNDDTDLGDLPKTVAYIRRYTDHVIVVGPINGYDRPLPELLANDVRTSISDTDEHRVRPIEKLDLRAGEISRASGAEYLSLYRLLCPRPSCVKYAAPGEPMQFDAFHLTPAGSIYVARRWKASGVFSFASDPPASSQRKE